MDQVIDAIIPCEFQQLTKTPHLQSSRAVYLNHAMLLQSPCPKPSAFCHRHRQDRCIFVGSSSEFIRKKHYTVATTFVEEAEEKKKLRATIRASRSRYPETYPTTDYPLEEAL